MIILYGAPLVYLFLFYCTQNQVLYKKKKNPTKSRMLNRSYKCFNQAHIVGNQ